MQPIQGLALSIAGFDPSGGAGVLADIKTFEQIGIYGCALITCITYQNDVKFQGARWLGMDEIEKQFTPLAERFTFEFIKIGLIQDIDILKGIVGMLKSNNPKTKIIWDPVLKTSSGALLHADGFSQDINEFFSNIYLVTPNTEEAEIIGMDRLKSYTNVLLKGGHGTTGTSEDILFTDGLEYRFAAPRLPGMGKHGSGCVLSSAVTGFLALGHPLEDACQRAKDYTYQFLSSTDGLLGHHYAIKTQDEYPIAY